MRVKKFFFLEQRSVWDRIDDVANENKGVRVCFRRRRKTKSFGNPEKAKAENSGRLGDCGFSIKRY